MSFIAVQLLVPFINFCEATPTIQYGRCILSLTLNAEILEASLIAFLKYPFECTQLTFMHQDSYMHNEFLYPFLSHSVM